MADETGRVLDNDDALSLAVGAALAARLPRFYRKFGKVADEHRRLDTLIQAPEESFPGDLHRSPHCA